MNKRSVRLPLFLLALVFSVFLIRRWNEPRRKEAFERNPPKLAYTAHALCQMECKNISKKEVEALMQNGIIIFNQSDRMARPCPIFALQGRTAGGKSFRTFFSQCPAETKVISCYYLKENADCYCSGKEKRGGQ